VPGNSTGASRKIIGAVPVSRSFLANSPPTQYSNGRTFNQEFHMTRSFRAGYLYKLAGAFGPANKEEMRNSANASLNNPVSPWAAAKSAVFPSLFKTPQEIKNAESEPTSAVQAVYNAPADKPAGTGTQAMQKSFTPAAGPAVAPETPSTGVVGTLGKALQSAGGGIGNNVLAPSQKKQEELDNIINDAP
jgi:hypothetical protein